MARVYTMGYGGLRPERLLERAVSLGVRVVVDVRRYSRSREECFSGKRLREELAEVGVEYEWMEELGALGIARSYRAEAVDCIASPTFRAYVAYLVSESRALSALARIKGMAVEGLNPLLLCRERRPEHCHRQFIADALAAARLEVVHVVGDALVAHGGSPCYSYIAAKLKLPER